MAMVLARGCSHFDTTRGTRSGLMDKLMAKIDPRDTELKAGLAAERGNVAKKVLETGQVMETGVEK